MEIAGNNFHTPDDGRFKTASTDRYFSARLIGLLPLMAGKRGEFMAGMYTYLRWADDVADEQTSLTKEQRLQFLERQRNLAIGINVQNPGQMEEYFNSLPWEAIPEPEVRNCIIDILSSIADDVNHSELQVRSEDELRQYGRKTFMPIIDGFFLVMNGKYPGNSESLEKFLDAYMQIGCLEDLGDDLNQGVVKVAMPQFQPGSTVTPDDVSGVYDNAKFRSMKWENLVALVRNSRAFAMLDIPAWQKIACMSYIFGEMIPKKSVTLSRKKALGF